MAKQKSTAIVPVVMPADPNRMDDMNLDLTKKYTKKILNDLDPHQALELLDNQVLTKNLLINEQILKILQQLHNIDENNWAMRSLLIAQIEKLTGTATSITAAKIALDKAVGRRLLDSLPDPATNDPKVPQQLTDEEFEKLTKVR